MWVQGKVQELIQDVLEEELTEFLGRQKSERIGTVVDERAGHRNGYGKPRWMALMSRRIHLRMPWVRGSDEAFESRILPLFKRRSREVGGILPELYLHGLAKGDFELAWCGLLSEDAPLSGSSIQRLKAKW